MKRTRIKRKRRSRPEYDRIYGSLRRVMLIKRMPCAVPTCTRQPCDNAHITNGGMGRKAGWQHIVPLCPPHHDQLDNVLGSVDAFDRANNTDLRAVAARLATEMLP